MIPTTADEVQPDAETRTTTGAPHTRQNRPTTRTRATLSTRHYVEKLRKESAGYRDKAEPADARADELSEQASTRRPWSQAQRLADPADLAYDAAHLDDADALSAAIDALPKLSRTLRRAPTGDVGARRARRPIRLRRLSRNFSRA